MDNHVPATSAAASTPSATSIPIPPLPEPTPAPSLQPPSTALQQQPPLSSQPPPSSSSAAPPIPSPSPNPNPNPNPSLRPSTQPPTAANRIPTFNRSWQHPHPHPHPHTHFPQFNSITSSPSSSLSASSGPSLSNSASHSVSAPQQRVGVAIGVPAPHPSPSPSPFSSSFGQQYAGLGRGTINMPDSVPNSSSSQVRGVQGMGMVGSMNSNSTIRPGGIPAHHQQRPLQSSIRPNMPSPNNQSSTTQNFQGHGFMRPSSIGSSGPNTSQSTQSPTQPWLPSGSQGKKPVPSPSFRPQMNTPSLQHRSHVPQRHHSLPTSQQQQHMSLAQQQQPMPSHQPAEHYGQQFPPVRPPRSITEQLALQVSTNSKQPPAPTLPPNPVQPVTQSKAVNVETEEPCNRILSKRSIHDLVSQIDPSEKLDPEVEDILVDIADEFVESITAFGCSLAKHRKSETLEAKDILLHLERNWNMSLPGFSSDEIKTFRKPLINDVHKERLAAIKKSILASEIAGAKITGGQGAGSAKSNMTKTPSNAMIGSNVKVREVT